MIYSKNWTMKSKYYSNIPSIIYNNTDTKKENMSELKKDKKENNIKVNQQQKENDAKDIQQEKEKDAEDNEILIKILGGSKIKIKENNSYSRKQK